MSNTDPPPGSGYLPLRAQKILKRAAEAYANDPNEHTRSKHLHDAELKVRELYPAYFKPQPQSQT